MGRRLGLTLVFLFGCGRATSVLLHLEFDGGRAIDQFQVSGSVDAGPVFGPVLRPDPPGAPLASPQTLRLLMDDALGGQQLAIDVLALSRGSAALGGNGQVTLVRGQSVDLSIALSARPDASADAGAPDGGAAPDAGAAADGGQDAGSCDSTSCPSGCCVGSRCQARSISNCGASGATCVDCGQYADTCTANGQCQCGSHSACALGQRCVAGNCACDSASCAGGCCALTVCTAPGFGACGLQGSSCVACNFLNADNCSDAGACSCGAAPRCSFGLQCVTGQCQCTSATCGGCCIDTPSASCENGNTPAACGTGGNPCISCDAGQSCHSGLCT